MGLERPCKVPPLTLVGHGMIFEDTSVIPEWGVECKALHEHLHGGEDALALLRQ